MANKIGHTSTTAIEESDLTEEGLEVKLLTYGQVQQQFRVRDERVSRKKILVLENAVFLILLWGRVRNFSRRIPSSVVF